MYIQRSRCQKGFFSKTTAHPLKKKKRMKTTYRKRVKAVVLQICRSLVTH